jgi:hypothetical protein
MKISYAVTVKDELKEISRLLPFLLENKKREDEIVILYDSKGGSTEVRNLLSRLAGFKLSCYEFDGHFANFKNHLTSLCTGDYIVNIDADELPTTFFMEWIGTVLQTNDVDILGVPRINTVEGLTEEHIKQWGWNVNEKGWVNWPDTQQRVYRNTDSIKWTGKVHETLQGHETYTSLPVAEEWAFLHDKEIKRQEKQNAYYSTL